MSLLTNQIKLLTSELDNLTYCKVIDTVTIGSTFKSLIIFKLDAKDDSVMEFVKLRKCYCDESKGSMSLEILSSKDGVSRVLLKLVTVLNDRIASHAVSNLLVLVKTFMVNFDKVEDRTLIHLDDEPDELKHLGVNLRFLIPTIPLVSLDQLLFMTKPTKDVQIEAKLKLKNNATILSKIASEFNAVSEASMEVHYDECNPLYAYILWNIKHDSSMYDTISLIAGQLNNAIITARIHE